MVVLPGLAEPTGLSAREGGGLRDTPPTHTHLLWERNLPVPLTVQSKTPKNRGEHVSKRAGPGRGRGVDIFIQ